MYAIDIAVQGRILYSSHTGCYSQLLKDMGTDRGANISWLVDMKSG